MAIERITLSVPEEVARRIKRAAGKRPVSSWVTELVTEHLDDTELDAAWEKFCEDVKPTREEIRRSEAMFARLTKRPHRKGAA